MTKPGSSQESEKITLNDDGTLTVPDNPQLIFIEGDGIGPDISRAAVKVFDSAVAKAYVAGGTGWRNRFRRDRPMVAGRDFAVAAR